MVSGRETKREPIERWKSEEENLGKMILSTIRHWHYEVGGKKKREKGFVLRVKEWKRVKRRRLNSSAKISCHDPLQAALRATDGFAFLSRNIRIHCHGMSHLTLQRQFVDVIIIKPVFSNLFLCFSGRYLSHLGAVLVEPISIIISTQIPYSMNKLNFHYFPMAMSDFDGRKQETQKLNECNANWIHFQLGLNFLLKSGIH